MKLGHVASFCAIYNVLHYMKWGSQGRPENRGYQSYRGGVAGPAGPAGPALAGPLFSGSLVSCPDCRDGLRTRRLGQVSHTSSPLPCVYAFLIIVPTLLLADQEPGAARPDCIGTHVLLNTHAYTTCSC